MTATENYVADLGPFYLGIARRARDELSELKGPPKSLRIAKDGALDNESSHYRHAIACIVFSAIAVEHELMRLIAFRIVIQSGDDRSRRLLMGAWPRRPRIDDMIRFVAMATQIAPDLLRDVRILFNDRNALVHAGIGMERTDLRRKKGAVSWEAKVTMPRLVPGIVQTAERDIQIASTAILALRNAVKEDEWRISKPAPAKGARGRIWFPETWDGDY